MSDVDILNYIRRLNTNDGNSGIILKIGKKGSVVMHTEKDVRIKNNTK